MTRKKKKIKTTRAAPASPRDGFNGRSIRFPDRVTDEATGKTLLVDAVLQNDATLVENLLKSGANANKATKEGKTPLHYAARLGLVGIAQKLLAAKAQVNPRDKNLETPIFDALRHDNPLPLLDLLLAKGGDASIGNALKEAPLHQALEGGKDAAVVKKLLLAVENPDTPDAKGVTPFLLACKKSKSDVVEAFVFERANFHLTDRDGNTCLHMAAGNPDPAVALLLLSRETAALVNALNMEGRSPLHEAIRAGKVEVVRKMIAAGANLNLPDNRKTTPLHEAVLAGNTKMTLLLMEAGADVVKAQNAYNVPLLLLAIRSDQTEAARLFLDAGADPDLADMQRVTPLMEAVSRNNDGIAKTLLERGADVLRTDHLGKNVLHHAGPQVSEELMSRLIKAGAPLDAQDTRKRTPLFAAVQEHRLMTALMLLDAGAQPDLADAQGFTPLHLGLSQRKTSLVDALLRKKADPNIACTALRTTPLHTACSLGLEREVELLLKNGAQVNAKDHMGRTPLHNAVQTHGFNTPQMAQNLLNAGADPTMPDNQGVTAYDLAWSLGKSSITEIFRKTLQKRGRTYKPKRPKTPPWSGGYYF